MSKISKSKMHSVPRSEAEGAMEPEADFVELCQSWAKPWANICRPNLNSSTLRVVMRLSRRSLCLRLMQFSPRLVVAIL